jgi:hypothetical protein
VIQAKPPYHVRETAYPKLGFCKLGAGAGVVWRIVDNQTGDTIGHNYPTRSELLADLARVAEQYGTFPGEPL